MSVGGLFSPEFLDAPWNMAKVGDLMKHLWVPAVVLAVDGHRFPDQDDQGDPPRRAQQALRESRQVQGAHGAASPLALPDPHRHQPRS